MIFAKRWFLFNMHEICKVIAHPKKTNAVWSKKASPICNSANVSASTARLSSANARSSKLHLPGPGGPSAGLVGRGRSARATAQ